MIQSTPVNFTTFTDRSNQSRYDNPNDVDLAIVALNGFVCGQNVIRVQKLGAAGHGWRACFCRENNEVLERFGASRLRTRNSLMGTVQ